MRENVMDLVLIGEGNHGKVYRLNDSQCIKVFSKDTHLRKELKVLKCSQGYPQFPKLYFWGENYIIREYIRGTSADQYIKEHGLSTNLAIELIELLDTFARLNFSKLDCRLSHIYVTNDGNIRVIDPARNMSQVRNYPKRLLQGLRRIGYSEKFLEYLTELRPELGAKFICSSN